MTEQINEQPSVNSEESELDLSTQTTITENDTTLLMKEGDINENHSR